MVEDALFAEVLFADGLVVEVLGFADFFSVFADAFARDWAGVFRAVRALRLESVFDADFFGDFRAMRLPFVAFRRSKGYYSSVLGFDELGNEALGLPSPDVGAVDTVEVCGLGLKVVSIRLLRSARN